MTLRMFHALVDRYELEWERRELLNAIVATTVANFSMGVDSNNYKELMDFMPSQQHNRKKYEEQKLRRRLRTMAQDPKR